MTQTIPAPSGIGTVLLDIGADTGALILHAPAELDGLEIEISPNGVVAGRAHTPACASAGSAPPSGMPPSTRRARGDVHGMAGRGHARATVTITGGSIPAATGRPDSRWT